MRHLEIMADNLKQSLADDSDFISLALFGESLILELDQHDLDTECQYIGLVNQYVMRIERMTPPDSIDIAPIETRRDGLETLIDLAYIEIAKERTKIYRHKQAIINDIINSL